MRTVRTYFWFLKWTKLAWPCPFNNYAIKYWTVLNGFICNTGFSYCLLLQCVSILTCGPPYHVVPWQQKLTTWGSNINHVFCETLESFCRSKSNLPPPGGRSLITSAYMLLSSPYLSRVWGMGVSVDWCINYTRILLINTFLICQLKRLLRRKPKIISLSFLPFFLFLVKSSIINWHIFVR